MMINLDLSLLNLFLDELLANRIDICELPALLYAQEVNGRPILEISVKRPVAAALCYSPMLTVTSERPSDSMCVGPL